MKRHLQLVLVLLLGPGVSAQDPSAPLAPTDDVPIDGPIESGQDSAAVEDETPPPPPFQGTFAQGMSEVAALADDDETLKALEVAESLLVSTRLDRVRSSLEGVTRGWSEQAFGVVDAPLAWFGFETRTARDRAEVHYAKGLLHVRLSAVESADDALQLARSLAGPGATRLDATYNLGTLDLALAEALRARIPELGGTPPQPAAPGMQNAQGGKGAGAEEPDPLQLARAAYRAAKDHFVERLRADWRDADTRANVELCMRRLAELDEIEKEREEQQQNEQNQEQSEDNQGDEQQDSESDPDEGESEPSEPEDGEQDQEQDQGDQEPQEDPGEPEGESEPKEGEAEERYLTEEEMKRLMDELREHDEEGERMRERVRRIRRVPVRRDW